MGLTQPSTLLMQNQGAEVSLDAKATRLPALFGKLDLELDGSQLLG